MEQSDVINTLHDMIEDCKEDYEDTIKKAVNIADTDLLTNDSGLLLTDKDGKQFVLTIISR